jgi:hypothetical protein
MHPLCKKHLNDQFAQTLLACPSVGLAQPIRNTFGLFTHGLIGHPFVGQYVVGAQCTESGVGGG